MGIISFTDMASSETCARRFILGFCWKNHQRYCPRCKERKLYKLSGGRRRCTRCLYTFHDFSRRYINGCAFTCQQWLWFLKLFEMNVPNQEIATQLRVSPATVFKANDLMRRAILAQAMDAAEYYSLGIWPGPGQVKTGGTLLDSPVFGLMEINGHVICDVLPEFNAENLLHFKLNFCLKTASLGQVVYTAPYQQYLTLVCCGPSLWTPRYIVHCDKRLPAESMKFWIYVKQQLKMLRGIMPSQFPLHLKEWELRFNHRDQSLLPVLTAALCGFVPQLPDTPQYAVAPDAVHHNEGRRGAG